MCLEELAIYGKSCYSFNPHNEELGSIPAPESWVCEVCVKYEYEIESESEGDRQRERQVLSLYIGGLYQRLCLLDASNVSFHCLHSLIRRVSSLWTVSQLCYLSLCLFCGNPRGSFTPTKYQTCFCGMFSGMTSASTRTNPVEHLVSHPSIHRLICQHIWNICLSNSHFFSVHNIANRRFIGTI